jgi:hypothetical protein
MQQQQQQTDAALAARYLHAAAHLQDETLRDFKVADPSLLRQAAALVARSLYDDAGNTAGSSQARILERYHRRWRDLGFSAALESNLDILWLTPWDTLHLYPNHLPHADAQCCRILLAMARTGRCGFDAPSPPSSGAYAANESPLHFAVAHCGPTTVGAIHGRFNGHFFPHEDALTALANARLDVLMVFNHPLCGVPGGLGDVHGRVQRPFGGTLLHAVCGNPAAEPRHIFAVVETFRVSPHILDDALRSPADVLKDRRAPPLEATIRTLEAMERAAVLKDGRHAAAVAAAERMGMPRDVALVIAKYIFVAH